MNLTGNHTDSLTGNLTSNVTGDHQSVGRKFVSQFCHSVVSDLSSNGVHPKQLPKYAIYFTTFTVFLLLYMPIWITIKKHFETNGKTKLDRFERPKK